MIKRGVTNTTEVTFGQGSVYMSSLTNGCSDFLALEEVESGSMGKAGENGRPDPSWAISWTSINFDDGRQRVILCFKNEEGLDQLILALEDLRVKMKERVRNDNTQSG